MIHFLFLPLISFGAVNLSTSINHKNSQLKQVELGKKSVVFEKDGLRFVAVVQELKEKFAELDGKNPYIIYGELYQDGKILTHPQILSLKDKEMNFTLEDRFGKKADLVLKISE